MRAAEPEAGTGAEGGAGAAAAVARLVGLEPGVPGLALLLADDALAGWLRRQSRTPDAATVRRPYLRWKPGAGGVARVDLGAGADELFLAVVHRGSAAKWRKTVQRSPGAVVAADADRLALLARPCADRDLPGLARLLRRGPAAVLRRLTPVDDVAGDRLRTLGAAVEAAGAPPVTLAWKPQRRWVGLLGDAAAGTVLRAVRPSALARAVAGYRAATDLGDGVPRLLGVDATRGLLAVEHLPGTTLDRLPGQDPATAAAAGALLARLHGPCPLDGRGTRLQPGEEARAVRAAGDLLGLLVPDAGAVGLADRAARRLLALPLEPLVTVHGDLSADQLLRRPDGRLALLDLDQAGRGAAAVDLASAAAARWGQDPATAAAWVRGLHLGYARVRPLPGEDALRVRTAAQLLRRAPEPFRTGRPGWPDEVAAAVTLAAELLDDSGAGAA